MFDRSRRIKRGWMKLKVQRIYQETWDTKTIILQDVDEGGCAFDYYAGQYLTFRLDGLSDKTIVRSYTLSSSPQEKESIAITVKKVVSGIASHYFCDKLRVGDVLLARGPMGRFIFEPNKDQKHLVMIAGGSGVTPFLSILKEYQNVITNTSSLLRKMSLIVTYKTKEDLIAWDLLQEMQKKDGIDIFITLSREVSTYKNCRSGRLNSQLITEAIGSDFCNKTFMTCGPSSMMSMVKNILLENRVHINDIKTESFDS